MRSIINDEIIELFKLDENNDWVYLYKKFENWVTKLTDNDNNSDIYFNITWTVRRRFTRNKITLEQAQTYAINMLFLCITGIIMYMRLKGEEITSKDGSKVSLNSICIDNDDYSNTVSFKFKKLDDELETFTMVVSPTHTNDFFNKKLFLDLKIMVDSLLKNTTIIGQAITLNNFTPEHVKNIIENNRIFSKK